MIVTPIVHDPPYPAVLAGPVNESNTPRSEGTLHLSTIYRDLDEAWRLTHRGEVDEDTNFYMSGGWLWEQAFALAHREAYQGGGLVRTDEWERDGIVGSPDSIRLDPYRVVEFKCTWRSSRKLESLERNFWTWLVQAKSYCYMVGTHEWELHAFFVNGNYRPPVPAVHSLLIEFNDEELIENWDMIVRHAQRKGWL